MEKYFDLYNKAVTQIARNAARDTAITIDLERIERILSAAESKIDTIKK